MDKFGYSWMMTSRKQLVWMVNWGGQFLWRVVLPLLSSTSRLPLGSGRSVFWLKLCFLRDVIWSFWVWIWEYLEFHPQVRFEVLYTSWEEISRIYCKCKKHLFLLSLDILLLSSLYPSSSFIPFVTLSSLYGALLQPGELSSKIRTLSYKITM